MGNSPQSTHSLEASWRAGISLREALNSFVRRARRIAPPALPELRDSSIESDAEAFRAVAKSVHDGFQHLAAVNEVERNRQQDLIDQILRGDLIAVGVDSADLSTVARVPPGLLQLKFFDWRSSVVEGHGRRLELVRVCRVMDREILEVQPKRHAGGRPTRRDEVKDVAQRLISKNVDLLSMTAKEAARAIRAELPGSPKGLGHEVVRIALNKLRGAKPASKP